MPSPEPSRDMHRVYEDCDPAYLRQLRDTAGMAVTALARTACLSVAQVRHLEGEGEGLFYSPSIKRQAYKRVLMILGAEPPMASPQEAIQAAQHGLDKASHDAVNRIVALAEHTQPLPSASSGSRSLLATFRVWQRAWVWGGSVLVMLGGVYLTREFVPLPWTWQSATSWFNGAPTPDVADTMPPESGEASPSPAGAQVEAVAPVASVAADPVIPILPSLAVAATPSKGGPMTCAHSAEAWPEVSVEQAHKAGNYVYVVSDTPMTVCVVDGAQQATLLELKPSEGRTVSGKSPWQIAGPQLLQAQIYFQGRRLALPEGKPQRVSLVEIPVAR